MKRLLTDKDCGAKDFVGGKDAKLLVTTMKSLEQQAWDQNIRLLEVPVAISVSDLA